MKPTYCQILYLLATFLERPARLCRYFVRASLLAPQETPMDASQRQYSLVKGKYLNFYLSGSVIRDAETSLEVSQ